MSLFDIKEVKDAAQKQMREKAVAKAKDTLVRQMEVVENARRILKAEELKLADIEQQISDGTL